MEKEFSLSDKENKISGIAIAPKEFNVDIKCPLCIAWRKEFVRLLKEECVRVDLISDIKKVDVFKIVDKIFGDKLI